MKPKVFIGQQHETEIKIDFVIGSERTRGCAWPMWQQRKPSLIFELQAFAHGFAMADDADDSDSDWESMGDLVEASFSDDDFSEQSCSDDDAAIPAPATPVRRSARNRDKEVDYVNEKADKHFCEYKGITHFGRTRKGGDIRPNADIVQPPKATRSSVTMLNFFAAPGKMPRPKPVIDLSSETKTKRDSPTTRTRWGRPPKSDRKSEQIHSMKKRVKRVAAEGALAVAPTPRRKWNGTVIFLLQSIYIYI